MTRPAALSSPETRSNVVRASAAYDLVVTAPFALPWTALWVADGLGRLDEAWALSGVAPSLDDPFALLFCCLMGSLTSIWSLARLSSPTLRLGHYDNLARLAFAAHMAWALMGGASMVIAAFLVAELSWALVQGLVVWGPAAPRSTRDPRVAMIAS